MSIHQAGEMPFEFKNLRRTRPIQIPLQLSAHGKRTVFQPPMFLLDCFSRPKIFRPLAEPFDRLLGLEEQFNILPKHGLIIFHRPEALVHESGISV